MKYRVELRNRDMEFQAILDARVADITFSFSPVGGCSQFSFRALSKYCTELDFGANFNVRISKRNDTTKDYDLMFQGRIENVINNVEFSQEDIEIQGMGYQSQLRDIVVNREYTDTEISDIVKDIMNLDVVPNTDIDYNVADIEDTGFTPATIKFSYVSALEALQKLSDIAGNREWGVDKNRNFYFKERLDDVTNDDFRFTIGKDISDFKINSSSREIISRVIVVGGDVSGNKYTFVKDYAKTQAKYRRRDAVIQNSAVVSDDVAEQLADAKQAEAKGVVDRGSFTVENEMVWEESLPLSLIEIKTREVLYDEKEYDTFLYAGQPPFRISKINYKISNIDSRLTSIVNFGAQLPNIIEDIHKLQFNLNDAVQARE